MMIGPAPMIMMVDMSVRLGIRGSVVGRGISAKGGYV